MTQVQSHARGMCLLTALSLGALSLAAVSPTAPAQDKTPYFPYSVMSLTVEDLPEPFHTRSVSHGPQIIEPPPRSGFTVPPGYEVSLFADELDVPRIVTVAPNGDVFVVESPAGRVTVLRDEDGDGTPDIRGVYRDDLTLPFGLAFHGDHIYIANTTEVIRLPYEAGDLSSDAEAEVIVPDLPGGGYRQHWTRNICFDASGEHLYVSVGSRSNASIEAPPRAAIIRCRPDGSESSLLATGLRNAAGIGINPASGALWAAVNERDGLGDDLVPDYFTAVQPGGFYGWPYSYLGSHRDPRVEGGDELAEVAIVPDVLIQSHSAPLGFCFYTGAMFPEEVQGDAFIALHGSWNRSTLTGYSVIRVPFDDSGRPVGWYEHFLRGWMADPESRRVWGRPVDVAVASDGALLVTDDGGGCVWRVAYSAP